VLAGPAGIDLPPFKGRPGGGWLAGWLPDGAIG